MKIPNEVMEAYGLDLATLSITQLNTGLINATWKLSSENRSFILQKINTQVFKDPALIASNINALSNYLALHFPAYYFVAPYKNLHDQEWVAFAKEGDREVTSEEAGVYRLFPFVPGSHTVNVLENADQASEAAKQFGRFTHLLSGFDVKKLKTTLPDFHNLSLRYQQFESALTSASSHRLASAKAMIDEIVLHKWIQETYEQIKIDPAFKLRVTHHDTKISNVLFDEQNHGICVIDLDTVMPGYFISDVGDMMRTYLSPVSEEETDLSKIEIRESFYQAIVQGYLSEMETDLSEKEINYFFYAGQFMIYMQAIRFLTDYLNNDVYYTIQYPDQNLLRTKNQLDLLQKYMAKETVLMKKN